MQMSPVTRAAASKQGRSSKGGRGKKANQDNGKSKKETRKPMCHKIASPSLLSRPLGAIAQEPWVIGFHHENLVLNMFVDSEQKKT
jgi:hypothetical protein